MPAANNGIDFPIAEPTPVVHDCGTGVNTDPVGELTAPIIGAVSLTATLTTPEMPMEIPTGGFILQDMLIDPFRGDRAGLPRPLSQRRERRRTPA